MPVALTVPLPARACPAPCSLGREQFRDLAGCADYPRIPAAVTSPKWLWLTLAMTRPETVRPH